MGFFFQFWDKDGEQILNEQLRIIPIENFPAFRRGKRRIGVYDDWAIG